MSQHQSLPESSNPESTFGYSKHEKYYLADGVIFLVEDTLFKVPRDKFIMSEDSVFTTMFRLPQSKDSEGLDDSHPIRLPGVASAEFERLLSFLYPLSLDYETFTQSWCVKDWVDILQLSFKWGMTGVKEAVINQLSKHFLSSDSARQINLGVTFQHTPWIKAGYYKLIRRNTPLALEEAQLLGMTDTVCFYAAREEYIRLSYAHPQRVLDGSLPLIFSRNFTGPNTAATPIVKEAFALSI